MSEPQRNPWLVNPATRVGRYLLFPGGHVVRLTRREQLLFALGLRKSMSTRTNRRYQ